MYHPKCGNKSTMPPYFRLYFDGCKFGATWPEHSRVPGVGVRWGGLPPSAFAWATSVPHWPANPSKQSSRANSWWWVWRLGSRPVASFSRRNRASCRPLLLRLGRLARRANSQRAHLNPAPLRAATAAGALPAGSHHLPLSPGGGNGQWSPSLSQTLRPSCHALPHQHRRVDAKNTGLAANTRRAAEPWLSGP